jgi:hypothetical protein
MVVRSTFEPESGPQYEYRTPFLAVDPFEDPSFIKRRLQLLELLHQTSAKIYFHELNNMIARSDFETAYFALRDSYPHVTKTLFRSLLRKAQKRHGSMFGLIAPVLEEEFRKGRLISLRQVVRNPEHRFFLALLSNLPNRSAILEFIRRKYSGNPNRWIKKWMLELTIPQSSLKDSNLIGIAWDDATDSMFRLMLSGQEFESILKQFEKIYSEAEVRRQQKKLIQLHSALRSSIFKPLFEQ